MTTQIGGLWTLFGLVALAGLFFALQRLRVRQRTLTVETTLFWRHAIEEARARVFVERFRHPWVYALLLLIAALLWLGFARLSFGAGRGTEHVVLVDGSAMSGRGTRLASTLELVESLAEGLEPASRSVVWCGGTTKTLLAKGEHSRLLRERAQGLAAEAVPASIEAALRVQLRRERSGPLRVYVAGDAPLDQALVASLPEDVRVQRLAPSGPAPSGNLGITALGAGPARSGAWDRVDVLVEVSADSGEARAPQLTIDGRASQLEFEAATAVEAREGSGSTRRFVLRDVPSQGQLLELRLSGNDVLASDDVAALVLPDRRPLRVALEQGLPPILASVIAADPELVVDAQNPQVLVRANADSTTSKLPALCFVEGEAGAAFALTATPGVDAQRTLATLHRRLGLAEIDANELARRTGRRITLAVQEGEERRVVVWRSLLSPQYNFVQSRSFPLFVSMSLRWLGGRWTPPESLAVLESVDLEGRRVQEPSGKTTTSLGDEFAAPRVGVYESEDGVRFAASLLSAPVSLAAKAGSDLPSVEGGLGGSDAVTWLLLLALLLLGAEWVLYGRGRMP